MFSSFFQHGFGLPAYDSLCELLDHYKIELVHLNPNSILQIVVFVHLCGAFLGIPPNFPLFKNSKTRLEKPTKRFLHSFR
jgi:hypothetical protein